MGKINPVDQSTGELKTFLVRRVFAHLQRTCTVAAYTRVDYLTLARRAGLPWVWRSSNAGTIVTLRAALARLERAGLLTVKAHAHDDVLVRLRPFGGEQ